MAITVRSTSSVNQTGSINPVTTPAIVNLPAPAGLAIGDYYVVALLFAAMLGTTGNITPPGFTLISDPGTSSNRQLLVFGRRITTSAELAEAASTPVRTASSSLTRVAAVGFALQGVNTSTPVGTPAAWVTGTPPLTFPAASGDRRFNFYYASSGVAVGAQTATGGSILGFANSPEGSAANESVVGVTDGGTGVSFAGTQPTVAGGFSLAFTEAAAAPTAPPYYLGSSAVSRLYMGTTLINLSGTTEVAPPVTEPVTPPTGTPTTGLAFTALDSGTGTKKAFAHYFGPFPISIDNTTQPDYWQKNWNLAQPGEGGIHTEYGGYSRDRPIYRSPRTGDWRYEDSKEDVRQAVAGGLDGFWNNIMGIGGSNELRYQNVALAAAELVPDGSFKVLPMIDTNGGIGDASAAQIADTIAWYAYTNPLRGRTSGTRRKTAWFTDGDRFVVGSYKADGKDAAWWKAIFDDLLAQYGITVAFVAVFSNYNNAASLNTVTWARGIWGDGADPNIARNYTNAAGSSATAGKKWMAPVWPQDMRPQGGLFDEGRGTEALRAYWERAIADDADMAQICTWSDYREHGVVAKSVKRGMAMIDLSAYYIHKWKTGNYPTILRDGFYLSHRNQMTGLARTAFAATTQGAYAAGTWAANGTTGKAADGLMGHWIRPNRSALANIVEVVTLLTAPAEVTINVGGTVTTYTATAGMFVRTVPLGLGTISVTITRSGSTVAQLTSPAVVRSNPYNQDMGYHTFSSFPTRTPAEVGQYDFQGYLLANM